MNMSNKHVRGAVSVFLVMIMVPCIVFTSIFVDLGRVHMATALTASSADLALNTMLTNYDADLSDWYGMAASCQSIDEFIKESEDYFNRALKSQGLSDDEITLLSDYFKKMVTDSGLVEESISDLLQIEEVTPAKITPVEGMNLTNATLIKDQVVEFMKYRAPIELTLGLFDKISNSAIDDVLKAEENNEIVEDKIEFYTAEGELLSKAYNTYTAVLNYHYTTVNIGLTNETFKDYPAKLLEFREIYEKIHDIYVTYLSNTSGLTQFKRPTGGSVPVYDEIDLYDEMGWDPVETETTVGYEMVQVGTDDKNNPIYEEEPIIETETTYPIDADKVDEVCGVFNDEYDDFYTLIQNFNDKIDDSSLFITVNGVKSMLLPGTGDNGANPIQWWVQANDFMNNGLGGLSTVDYYSEIKEAAEDLVDAYGYICAVEDCKDYDKLSASSLNVLSGCKSTYNQVNNKYFSGSDTSEYYTKLVTNLETVSTNNINKIKPENHKVVFFEGTDQEMTKTIGDAIKYIGENMSSWITGIDKCIEYLDIAINGHGLFSGVPKDQKAVSLDKLLELVKTYNTTLNTWSETTEDVLSRETPSESGENKSMAQECKEEIAKIKNETPSGDNEDATGTDMSLKITEESVAELKTRLTNIKTQLETIKKAVDEMKYNKPLGEITSYEVFVECAKKKVKTGAKDIGLTDAKINENASKWFSDLFRPKEEDPPKPILEISHLDDPNYNPQINPETGEVNTPELFRYFYQKWYGKNKQQIDDKKEEQNTAKEKGSEQEKAATEKPNGRYHYSGGEIKADFSVAGEGMFAAEGETFSLGKSVLSGFTGLIKDITSNNFDGIRDDLYVTAYIMNMFSYATYEYEGKYQLLKNQFKVKQESQYDPKELTLSNYPQAYSKVTGNANGNEEGTWLSINFKDAYNKSLTNKMINATNNYAYCAEIEYILYGNTPKTTSEGWGFWKKTETVASTNKENIDQVYGNIYAIRYILNLVSGFANFWTPNNATANTIDKIAYSIQALTSGIVPVPLTKVILIPILTIFETAKDMDRLEVGFPVELYKKTDEQWWINMDFDLKDISAFMEKIESGGIFTGKNEDTGFFYSDYLMIFVYLGLTSPAAESMYQRMAEVMQSNIKNQLSESDSNAYSLRNAHVYFRIDAEVRVKPLMIALPIFDEYDGADDARRATDWCTYKIATVRGYS